MLKFPCYEIPSFILRAKMPEKTWLLFWYFYKPGVKWNDFKMICVLKINFLCMDIIKNTSFF